MARLNAKVSSMTPAPRSLINGTISPSSPGPVSDQENRDPGSTQRIDKGKGRMGPPPAKLPTPTSDNGASAGSKRKRGVASAGRVASGDEHDEEPEFTQYYDPNQDPEERRNLKRKSRALEREFNENREDFLKNDNTGLTRTVKQANKIYAKVKQTSDATSDSRLLVNVSDLAYKKSAQLVLGDTSTGVDVDEFLSKAITFMRNGGPQHNDDEEVPGSSSRRRRHVRRNDDSEDEEEDVSGDALDWECLGTHACFPYNTRPPVPGFLLGPLSVEKKARIQTQRRARQAKEPAGREARPEALTKDDLEQTDNNGLTTVCTRIHKHLVKHCSAAEAALNRAGIDDLQSQRGKALLKKHRISTTGGVSLFDFVINPTSFGQTVENLFYTSFLIKEGSFGIQNDESDLPTIIATQPQNLEEQRARKVTKHQAVFALDYKTWKDLVAAYEIKEPMIAHREDEQPTQVGARGWYG